jgi:membrane protein implicated in regulation of membrane protease activity
MLRAVAEARAVKRRIQSLAKLNLELAKLELQQKATGIGIAVGLVVGAVVLVVYAIGFGFAAVAAALNISLPLWASLLIVMGSLLLVAAILVFLAVRFVRKAMPPKPAQAIAEAEQTVATVKSHA